MKARNQQYFCFNFNKTIFFLFISIQSVFSQEQYLVNKAWTTLAGNPASGLEWSASTRDSNGDIYTTGNSVDANFSVNLLLYKQSPSGQILWEVLYDDIANAKSYGIAVTVDSNDDVYVAGAIYNPFSQNHDYLILKYNPQGVQLWSQTFAGSGNGDDFPSSIALDSNDDVYITGVTYNPTTDYDYLTIKVDSSGVTDWSKQYDYTSLAEAAVAIEIKGSGANTKIMVTGGSASSATDWDYANIIYDGSDGTVLNEVRTGASGTGLELPTALTTDIWGNSI